MAAKQNEVVGLDWSAFIERMRTGLHPDGSDYGRWEVGQHVAVSAPTGEGKSTFLFGLATSCRRYVAALDPKGGDETASAAGYQRLTSWDNGKIRRLVSDNDNADPPRPSRFLVGRLVRTRTDRAANRRLMATALDGAWDLGGFTVIVPDLQMVTDPRFMGLSDRVEEMLITARSPKHITVMTDFQRPARVPPAAGDQTRFFALGYTRDRRVIERFAEMLGRDYGDLRGATKGLGRAGSHHWIVGTRNPREPLIVTKPVIIRPKRRAA